MSRLVVLLVFCHFVNEKQGQNLDSLMEELTFPFDMRENRFTDLNAPELIFADLADYITGKDFDAVQELYGIVPSINGFHHKANLVLVQIAGVVV